MERPNRECKVVDQLSAVERHARVGVDTLTEALRALAVADVVAGDDVDIDMPRLGRA